MKNKKFFASAMALAMTVASMSFAANAAVPAGATLVSGTDFESFAEGKILSAEYTTPGQLWFDGVANRNAEHEYAIAADATKYFQWINPANMGATRRLNKSVKIDAGSSVYVTADVRFKPAALPAGANIAIELFDSFKTDAQEAPVLAAGVVDVNKDEAKPIFRVLLSGEEKGGLLYYGVGTADVVNDADVKIEADGFSAADLKDQWLTVEIALDYTTKTANISITNKATGKVYTQNGIALAADIRPVGFLAISGNRSGGTSINVDIDNVGIYSVAGAVTPFGAATATEATPAPAQSTPAPAQSTPAPAGNTPAPSTTDVPPTTSTGDKTNPVTGDVQNAFYALILSGLLVAAFVVLKKKATN